MYLSMQFNFNREVVMNIDIWGRECSSSGSAVKPPLGLSPRRLWLEARFKEVSAAITRYKEAGLEIPTEWYEEFFELVEVLY